MEDSPGKSDVVYRLIRMFNNIKVSTGKKLVFESVLHGIGSQLALLTEATWCALSVGLARYVLSKYIPYLCPLPGVEVARYVYFEQTAYSWLSSL